MKASDIQTDQTVYGAYEKVGELNGAHFEIEDDGMLPNGGTDGGHHNEATAAMANMAISGSQATLMEGPGCRPPLHASKAVRCGRACAANPPSRWRP